MNAVQDDESLNHIWFIFVLKWVLPDKIMPYSKTDYSWT